MYVVQVIERADRLYPNEYETEEKIEWIDELNEKIAQEYRRVNKFVDLEAGVDGSFLLPEDVTWERVHSIRAGAHEIKKEDFTTYGVRFINGIRNRLALPAHMRNIDTIRVIYREAAEKIRVVDLEGVKIEVISGGFLIDKQMFKAGDILEISEETSDGAFRYWKVNVFDCYIKQYSDDDAEVHLYTATADETRFFVECGTFSDSDIGTHTVSMQRVITEKTLCEPPYDDMYVQWVCAKICFWQKAFEGYNQHMTMFNQILSDYAHMIIENEPGNDRTQWKGWLR